MQAAFTADNLACDLGRAAFAVDLFRLPYLFTIAIALNFRQVEKVVFY